MPVNLLTIGSGSGLDFDDISVVSVDDLERALAKIGSDQFDAVVIDLRDRTHVDPSAAIDVVHDRAPQMPLLVVAAADAEREAMAACGRGADDYLLDDELGPDVVRHAVRVSARAHGSGPGPVRDPLTGLVTGPVLDDRLERAIARASRRDEPLALVVIDIDQMAEINATHGRTAGDRLLAKVAERLTTTLRDTDTAARRSGDQFHLLLENVGTRADARRLLSRLADRVRVPVAVGGEDVVPTFCAGVAMWPDHASAADSLREAAVEALRIARGLGRDRVELAAIDLVGLRHRNAQRPC